jgi:cytochrome c556
MAEETKPADPRTSLDMTAAERAEFLSEMRKMLGSIQGVLQGISTEDRAMIAEFATQSSNKMARATPDTLRNRLPQAFKDIGGPTHMLFEELVIRAETDDMQDLLKHTATIMNQCMSCHAQFRAD